MARRHQPPGALPVAASHITQSIRLLRGQRVMLDADLAALYQVETRALTQAVKRNPGRFPPDFMFPLTREEFANLRSQSVISSAWGGRRYPPRAVSEQGATTRAPTPCASFRRNRECMFTARKVKMDPGLRRDDGEKRAVEGLAYGG